MTAEVLEAPAAVAPTATPPHPLREFWSYFSANHGAVAGLVVIVAVLLTALFADVIAPHSPDPDQQRRLPASRRSGRRAARWTYPLGTDAIGRDILSRLIYGARLSLLIGIAVVALSIAVGIVLGPGRRLRPRRDRDRDHAADGHHPDAAEPAARDRHRRDPRARA